MRPHSHRPLWRKKLKLARHYLKTNIQIAVLLAAAILVIVGLSISFFWNHAPSVSEEQARVGEIIKSGKLADCAQADQLVIMGVRYGTLCRNNIVYNEALDRGDPALCGGVDGIMMRAIDCRRTVILKVVGEGRGTKDLCALEADPAAQAFCLDAEKDYAARKSGDPSLCKPITDAGMREDCRNALLLAALRAKPRASSCAAFPKNLQNDCAAFVKIRNCAAFRDPLVQKLCAEGQ